ncbi:hypothetical protein [Mesorhizobium sp.]|uniref:hypothetical protein n=1 Tax=Mesorhizobium sp. TaxID=1871066 RepID=UPI000FEA4835|nr:hypothetical protein [Mesorhizobium sp.]RWA59458.1 MAG: hypothetical protein EOQ27_26425 [Mesorhizobium sp.]
MIVRRSAQVDLPRVFDVVADRLSSEYLASERYQGDSNATFEDALRKAKNGFRKAIKENRADTLLISEGAPIALVRWQIQDGEAHTGFAAQEAFFEAKYVRPMARYVRDLQARLGNVPLVAANWSGREDARRWFEVLGYEFLMHYGPAQIFLLRAR